MSSDSAPEILYIEDDRLTAKLVLNSLVKNGYIITHVESGQEAINAVKEKEFDLIATDLVLPDMDGTDVIRQLKEVRPLPPLVVITGFGDERTVVEVMRLGATDYIPKDTDGRYIILLPTVLEKAIYQGRMNNLKQVIEKELHFSRENFRNLLNATKDFIFVIDAEGKLLNYNPALKEAVGYSDDELRHMSVMDLHQKECRQEVLNMLDEMVEGKRESCTIPMQRKNGELFDIETRISKGRWGDSEVLYVITRDMTKQREAERGLRESRQMLELVMDNIPEHIFWKDPDLRYLGCNLNYARSAGLHSPDSLIGKTDEELGPQVLSDEESLEHQRKVLETGEAELHVQLETEYRNGRQVIFDVNRIPLRDDNDKIIGLLSTREDITERVQMANTLREREQLLSVVTTNLRDVVGLVDRRFIWQYVSPSHKDVLGYSPDELSGTSPLVRIHDEDKRRVEIAIARGVAAKVPQRVEFRYQHADGRYLWLECIGAPIIEDDGSITSVVLASRDISERKDFENQLIEKSEQLEESNEELDAFSHTVAHDLKNPLNSILGLSNLLRESVEMSQEEIEDSLKFIEQSATNMNGIIDSLMVLSGVRKEEITPQPLDMADVVAHTIGRLTFYVHDMNAELIKEEFPQCLGYAPWVEEVWVNYITNAVKYGGSPPKVVLGGEVLDDGRVKYWVKDNGPGISDEDQKRLFVPFSRLRQVSVKGYGLGLSIVTRIITRLEGEVGIHSTLGEGSTFYFILPGVPETT